MMLSLPMMMPFPWQGPTSAVSVVLLVMTAPQLILPDRIAFDEAARPLGSGGTLLVSA